MHATPPRAPLQWLPPSRSLRFFPCVRPSQITMRIFPGEIPRSLFTSTSIPHVAFVSDRHQMRVSVYESTTSPIKGGR